MYQEYALENNRLTQPEPLLSGKRVAGSSVLLCGLRDFPRLKGADSRVSSRKGIVHMQRTRSGKSALMRSYRPIPAERYGYSTPLMTNCGS